jgi:hypothetical protein
MQESGAETIQIKLSNPIFLDQIEWFHGIR